jgi:hypothetical protein
MTTHTTRLMLAALLAIGACDSAEKSAAKTDDKKATDKKADAKAGDAKTGDAKAGDAKAADADAGEAKGGAEPAAEGPAEVSLDAIGLKAEAPAGATVGKAIGGSGVMVQAPGLVVTVEEASDTRPKTPEAAKEDADMYTPQNWKVETVEGGFVATFDNSGSMGANYFVSARREIDGKSYWCSTTASQAEQQAAAVAFCKSLKK